MSGSFGGTGFQPVQTSHDTGELLSSARRPMVKQTNNKNTAVAEWSNRHIWLAGCDPQTEHRQAIEEGRDLRSVETEFARLTAKGAKRNDEWIRAVQNLADVVQRLPIRADYPYNEP